MNYLDCISVENMRESDRLTIEGFCPGRTLMYRAALGVFRAAAWDGTQEDCFIRRAEKRPQNDGFREVGI